MIKKIDINEVERNLPSGKPSKIQALDGNGNMLCSTLSEVASALPRRNHFSVTIEPGEIYSLQTIYFSAFIYQTNIIGDGCIVLFCWVNTIVFGSGIFANSDTPRKVCIYNQSVGNPKIKNNTSDAIVLTINVV